MAPAKTPLTKSQLLGLGAMSMGVLVIANDFTALSVALPHIERTFHSSVTTTQWIINGYALVFGVLIVTGGRLADMFGRRRIFFIGSAIFAGFSLLGGLATDIWALLAARGAMGIGGAMMWPAILGMTYGLLPSNRAAIAGALILGSAGFGNAVGPLLGGVLTDLLSWRWIFYLNIPIAALGVLVTWRVVPKVKPDDVDHRIDYGGVVTLSVGLFALLLTLDLGTSLGWIHPTVIALFSASALSLGLFAFVERRAGSKALIPKDVLENRAFFSAFLATLMNSAIFFAALLYLPQFMSKVLGFKAIESGAGLLPVMGVFAIASFVAGPLYERFGAKAIVSTGAAFLATGMFMLSRIDPTTTFLELIPGMVVLGTGIGLFYSSITTAGITALDPSRASLGGAIIYMAQIAGGAIGLGVNTAIVVSATVFADGIGTAFLVDSALAVCALAVSLLFIGGRIDRATLHSLVHRHRAHG
jgi:EmrB/QacA subfamily drug resistance transporter